jgi:hypothetical protein
LYRGVALALTIIGWPMVMSAQELTAWRSPAAAFVENRGQWDTPALFVRRQGPLTVRVEPDALVLHLEQREESRRRGVVLRLAFEGASQDVEVVGEGRLPGNLNFFLGNDPEQWQTDVARYEAVELRGLWEGIDVRLSVANQLSFVVGPGADPDQVVMVVEGADALTTSPEGALVLETPLGSLRLRPPDVESAEGQSLGTASYRDLGEGRFGLSLVEPIPPEGERIGSGLEWSSYLGGTGSDRLYDVAIGGDGDIFVLGYTTSLDFPVTPGAFDETLDVGDFFALDVVVARLNENGTQLEFATYLGGEGNDFPTAIDVTREDDIVVSGWTGSDDFPITGGALQSCGVSLEGFVTRLANNGTVLEWSTCIGGSGTEVLNAMSVEAGGRVTVVGETNSTDFPVTPGALDTVHEGGWEGFVTRLEPDGSAAVFSTLLGGASEDDRAMAVAVTAGGATVVAGRTSSPDFPTTPGAYSTTQRRMFVSRLDPTGSRLEWSTYFGSEDEFDRLTGLGIDVLGNVTVVGYTDTGFFADSNFPTTEGAFDTTPGGGFDGFVATLDATGSRLLFSTFLGSGGFDRPRGVAVDSAGVITVVGYTFALNFPVTPGAFQIVHGGGGRDAFVTRLSPKGDSLYYSTYIGGSASEGVKVAEPIGIALDETGDAVIVGVTASSDFPTTPGAFGAELQGPASAFIAQLDMLPTGASKYGASTPGAQGPLAIGVTAMPQIGADVFALTCTNAPPVSIGLLLIGTAARPTPLSLLGADIWVDLTAPLFRVRAESNAAGFALIPLPIPADGALVGVQGFAQFVWLDPRAPGRLLASNALAITVQP